MSSAVEKRQHYSEEQKQRALVAIAAASGNTRLASTMLAQEGFEVDHKTIWRWQQRMAEDYARIRADLLPKLREEAADQHRALARLQASTSLEATELIKARLPQMDDRDLINATGKLDIGSGIHDEKALLHDGQPTQIVQRSSQDILRELEAEGLKLSAIEAEVVSEEDVTEVVSEAVQDGAVPA